MSEQQQNRTNKFLKDIGIYAIGNLGSKLVTFMLVPLYTYYVSPAEYGYYDLCLTAVLLLIPFLSLTLRDGSFRFLVDADGKADRGAIVTFVYRTLITNSLLALCVGGIIAVTYPIEYIWETIGLLIAMSLYEVIIQVVRGLGLTTYFVAAGIVNSLLIGVFSIVFVVVMKMRIEGIFIANVAARFATVAILELRLGIMRKYFGFRFNDKEINGAILKYSLPLLPGSICWWLMGCCNRWFIQHYIGLESNGQYAVALKFAAILETLATIFYQTWQETALRQYNSPDRDRFFSQIFNNYVYVLMSGVVLFSFVVKLNYSWLVSEEFRYSINYVYPLALSAMFFSMSAFYDMGYQCSKKTIFTLPGIILASAVNVVGNYFLIQICDVYGVIVASVLTYIVLYTYRAIDTRKYFRIHYKKGLLLPAAIVVASGVAFYAIDSIPVTFAYLVAVAALITFYAPDDIRQMVTAKLLRRRRG